MNGLVCRMAGVGHPHTYALRGMLIRSVIQLTRLRLAHFTTSLPRIPEEGTDFARLSVTSGARQSSQIRQELSNYRGRLVASPLLELLVSR